MREEHTHAAGQPRGRVGPARCLGELVKHGNRLSHGDKIVPENRGLSRQIPERPRRRRGREGGIVRNLVERDLNAVELQPRRHRRQGARPLLNLGDRVIQDERLHSEDGARGHADRNESRQGRGQRAAPTRRPR